MKKISLKEVRNSLRRDEMRMIFGGSGTVSGGCGYSNGLYLGGGGGCTSNCSTDNDCNCNPCNRPGIFMSCQSQACSGGGGIYYSVKRCSC